MMTRSFDNGPSWYKAPRSFVCCHFVRKSLELLQNAVLFLNLVDHFTLILKLFASRRQKQYPLHLDYIVILGLKG